MALTLTATPATPQPFTVTLDIAGATGTVVVARTVDGKSQTLRNGNGITPPAGAGTLVDYDAPLGRPFTYTVTDSAGAVASVEVTVPATSPVISHAGVGVLQVAVELVDDAPMFAGQSRRHEVIGRADPIYTVAPLSTPAGTMRVIVDSLEASETLGQVLADGWPFLWRVPCAGMSRDGWRQPRAIREDVLPGARFGAGMRMLTIDYDSTGPPSETVFVPSTPWTVQAVVDAYSSVAVVRDTFRTVAGLASGVEGT